MRGRRISGSAESRSARLRDGTRRFVSRAVIVALALELVIAAIDIALGRNSLLTSSFLVPVLAVAVVDNGERTAGVALTAIALALLSGAIGGYLLTGSDVYRIAIVAGGGVLGVLAATSRSRAEVARDQMEMLARIAEIADGAAELEDALQRLAAVLVPGAADLCELVTLTDGQAPRAVAREGVSAPRPVGVDIPDAVIAEIGLGRALLVGHLGRSGHGQAVGLSATEVQALRAVEMASVIFAPVRVADETLALLVLAVGPSGRRYGHADLRFARTVGSRAALAIQNARLLDQVHEAQQRMAAIVGTLADAVTIRDLSGHLIYANDAARRLMNLTVQDEIELRDPESLFAGFGVTGEDGAPISMPDLPSVRLLAGEEEPEPLSVRVVDEATGEEAWRILKSTPLYDLDGRLEAAVTVIEDVTATKRAQLRSHFLSRASDILASSLDYEQTLKNVAELAVPALADWCAVDLLDERGRRVTVVAAHRDPAKAELARRLEALEPEDVHPGSTFGHLLVSGEPLLHARVDEERLAGLIESEARRDAMRAMGFRSVVAVPLRGADRVLGVLVLAHGDSPRRFSRDDVDFAMQIAARVAVAVENARIYGERSRIASTLQHSLLPARLPEIPGWEIGSLYRPAGAGGGVEVGGDFYDAFPVQGGWMVLIGDVTGKGVEAAAMTALVRHGARFISEYAPEPGEVLARLDRALRRQPVLSLCTALCLRLDADRVTIASGGHPLPLLVGESGVAAVGEAGSVLGAFEDGAWPAVQLTLRAAEVLLLFTDGVTDTVGTGGRFGEDRLREAAGDCGPRSPDELLACLDAALRRFQAGAQADDTAALALRLAGGVMAPVLATGARGLSDR